MSINDVLPLIGFCSYLVIDFLIYKYLRERNWKGIIPYLYQKTKKSEN